MPGTWNSNPQGCGAEETRSVFQRSTRGPQARSGARAAKPHADIPHRPPLNWKRSSKGDRFCLGPSQRDSNPTGCGAEETRSVFQRSTRGAERRSGARTAPAARGHPSSPTTELETVLARGPFLFTPGTWDSNPSARLSQRPWPLQIYGKKGSRPSKDASNDAPTIWNPFKLAMFYSR